MKVSNCKVYHNGKFSEGRSIYMEHGLFTENSSEEAVLDGEGCFAIPGLIDIHFHGCSGADFCDGTFEAMRTIAAYELEHGITAIHPATMTLPEERLLEVSECAKQFKEWQQQQQGSAESGAELVGIYMEGPFFSKEKKGAQNPAYLRNPDKAMVDKLQGASGGLYHICALAPETEGAMAFIDEVKGEIRLAAGHTTAGYDMAKEAFTKGVSQVTHLYNAMMPFTHREPGLIGAAYEQKHVMAELICDGVHVHPTAIKMTFDLFGRERIIMISDSMMATGMPDGIYALGGQEVKVEGNLATLTVNGAIAGSATNLFDCMRYAVLQAGLPLASVVSCVTENPAKAAGIWETHGSIEYGKRADLILLDKDLNIRHIIRHGKIIR